MAPSSLHWPRTPRWPGAAPPRPSSAAPSSAARVFFVLSMLSLVAAAGALCRLWHVIQSGHGLAWLPWGFAGLISSYSLYVSVRVGWALWRNLP